MCGDWGVRENGRFALPFRPDIAVLISSYILYILWMHGNVLKAWPANKRSVICVNCWPLGHEMTVLTHTAFGCQGQHNVTQIHCRSFISFFFLVIIYYLWTKKDKKRNKRENGELWPNHKKRRNYRNLMGHSFITILFGSVSFPFPDQPLGCHFLMNSIQSGNRKRKKATTLRPIYDLFFISCLWDGLSVLSLSFSISSIFFTRHNYIIYVAGRKCRDRKVTASAYTHTLFLDQQ